MDKNTGKPANGTSIPVVKWIPTAVVYLLVPAVLWISAGSIRWW